MDQYEQQRREKLKKIIELGEKSYRNDLKPTHTTAFINDNYKDKK